MGPLPAIFCPGAFPPPARQRGAVAGGSGGPGGIFLARCLVGRPGGVTFADDLGVAAGGRFGARGDTWALRLGGLPQGGRTAQFLFGPTYWVLSARRSRFGTASLLGAPGYSCLGYSRGPGGCLGSRQNDMSGHFPWGTLGLVRSPRAGGGGGRGGGDRGFSPRGKLRRQRRAMISTYGGGLTPLNAAENMSFPVRGRHADGSRGGGRPSMPEKKNTGPSWGGGETGGFLPR